MLFRSKDAKKDPRYDRLEAQSEALKWADSLNVMVADCTYYVSLAMLEGGGLPKTDRWTTTAPEDSPWRLRKGIPSHVQPGVTAAFVNANEFTRYMEESGTATVTELSWNKPAPGSGLTDATEAELADVIAYDWEGDGTIDHLAMVTGRDQDHYPLVSQHTPNQTNRYWSWSETAHNWISVANPGARVYLIHITA